MKKAYLLLCAAWYLVAPVAAQQPPARFDIFREQNITAIRPAGWLEEFLERQRSGLTGHPEVLSYPFNSVLWAGVIDRVGEQHGANWWRYEQTAYYSDGLLRLGYLLQDTAMINKAYAGIRHTLAHPQPNGRLGPQLFTSQWPMAVYFRVLQAAYAATGDTAIINALYQHYLSYTPEEIGQAKRAIVNLEGMLWTYGKTNDPRLLQLAENAYALGGFELNMTTASSPDTLVLHGVTYMEMAKLPAILYSYTGKKRYLDAAINAMYKLDRDHMLPDGIPSSNEFLAGKDPLQSHETCDITDYTWTAGYLLMITGDGRWADKLERAVFNAGPGAVSKDFKNLQYFSSVNQVIATGNSNHNKFAHGSTWMAYWPCHETECCAGNVHRFMPNYAARMWMQDTQGAPVAALYGPSVDTFHYRGKQCVITEDTRYPFADELSFTFNMPQSLQMPFTFRIPAWCKSPVVLINDQPYTGPLTPGAFVTLQRRFRNNDRIRLRFPMTPQLLSWGTWGAAVERGPLLYTYPVPEKVTTDTATYANLGGKHSPDPGFPALDIRPDGPWNYALLLQPEQWQVISTPTLAYPFDSATTIIKVPVRKILSQQLTDNRYTPALPAPGSFSYATTTDTISLVPYGTTRLRVTVFPVIP